MLLMIGLMSGIGILCTKERNFLGNLGKYNEAMYVEKTEMPGGCVNGLMSEYNRVSGYLFAVSVECNNVVIAGNQPCLTVESVEKEKIVLNEEDKMILYKIVEAEAGGEDRTGKILVANVILNRLEDEHFPNTVEGVVFQQKDGVAQFSPVANGRYQAAVPGKETIEAVEAAIGGEDYSEGALYFMARKYAEEENVKWFDASLDKVLAHGGHEFYK